MYPAESTRTDPDRPCFIMAATGETVTYGELNARANRLAHLFVAHGLQRGDHYSILMENNSSTSRPAPPGSAPACTTRASIPI